MIDYFCPDANGGVGAPGGTEREYPTRLTFPRLGRPRRGGALTDFAGALARAGDVGKDADEGVGTPRGACKRADHLAMTGPFRLLGFCPDLGKSVQLARQGVFGLHTDNGVFHFAVLDEHEHGDGAHVVLGGQVGVFVHIDFGDLDGGSLFSGQLFQDRCQHPAGAAPFSPKVHDDRDRAGGDFRLKVGFVQVEDCFGGHRGIV